VTLKARLASVEQRLAILRPGLRVVTIRGGLTADASGDIATIDGAPFGRQDNEPIEDFRARARATAIDAGAKTLIFGGLPARVDA
jgi:hypothetical protein